MADDRSEHRSDREAGRRPDGTDAPTGTDGTPPEDAVEPATADDQAPATDRDQTAADLDDLDPDGTGGDASPSPRPRPRTGWERLSETFLRPASPPGQRPAPEKVDFAAMTDDEKRARISQIDPTERKVGLAASVMAAVLALVYTVPYMVAKISVVTTVKPVHKTCTTHFTYVASSKSCNGPLPASHYVFYLVLWLVFAAAIYVTVRINRRAPMAFAIVLTGLAFGTVIIMLPYVVVGGWLLLRAYRTQKYGSPTAKAPLEGYVKPPPKGSRAAGPAARAGAGGGAGPRNTTRRRRRGEPEPDPGARQPPAASKRYTPKAPPRKKVPPPG
jgi:hypothetical protein